MLTILYEDNHLLGVFKPPGLSTMGRPEGEETLLTRAKDYLKQKYCKPGNVYLGVVSRLDTPVSGVVLFARTSKAAARINEQFRTHAVEKTYHALVEGNLYPEETQLVDFMCEDPRHRKMWITKSADGADVKEAKLHYRKLAMTGKISHIQVLLETGRKHQIRLQLSHHGFPILGDRKYGARRMFPDGIALHARSLAVTHPVSGEPVKLTAPFPASWKSYGFALE
ncbi:MAG: RluA family pseudouridine synthase [Planctomycetaceae bacterium]|nr:RluA family pseudouridine synthase [Planctomycetaceae bacterium]